MPPPQTPVGRGCVWGGDTPSPHPTPLGAYGASIVTPLARQTLLTQLTSRASPLPQLRSCINW